MADEENQAAPASQEMIPGDEDAGLRQRSNKDSTLNDSTLSAVNDDNQDLTPNVPASFRLATSKRALEWSLWSIRLGVFADSVTATILDPNYAFMAIPDAHKDSFDSTAPFGQTAATYFLAMTALLGAAIGSTIIGQISDRVGRKPTILLCLGVGAIGAVCNYIARKSFWGFCASNFGQGLFAATLPVAMAYVSDVKPTRKEKDAEIGVLIGLFMIGSAGGGVAAIVMEEQGLFAPLFVGASLNVIATIVAYFFLIEPRKIVKEDDNNKNSPESQKSLNSVDDDDDDIEDEDANAPDKLNIPLLYNIVFGALLDNIGSAGLLPLAMAPLALREFYTNFLEAGEEPIMTQTAFKWLSVMVALTVIPGAAFSQYVFDRITTAGGCIMGNTITGIMIIAVLYIAQISPATNGTYVGFICCLYIGFPFTVLSQLSTGPMLDMISPVRQRGMVQGINVSVMNFGTALSPYILGEISDNLGVSVAMWICIAVSFAAALVNVPLVFSKLLKPQPKVVKLPKYARNLKWEDPEFVERALRGDWVPAQQLETLNMDRMRKGQPFLLVPYRSYAEDKEHLSVMKVQAKRDFLFLRNHLMEVLEEYKSDEERQALVDQLYQSSATPEQVEEQAKGLGRWFVDYLQDVGYWVDDSPTVFKQMIMQAFPPITHEKEITVDNVEDAAINMTRVFNKYLDEDEYALGPATKALAGSVVVY